MFVLNISSWDRCSLLVKLVCNFYRLLVRWLQNHLACVMPFVNYSSFIHCHRPGYIVSLTMFYRRGLVVFDDTTSSRPIICWFIRQRWSRRCFSYFICFSSLFFELTHYQSKMFTVALNCCLFDTFNQINKIIPTEKTLLIL